jgi:hypothetical protein
LHALARWNLACGGRWPAHREQVFIRQKILTMDEALASFLFEWLALTSARGARRRLPDCTPRRIH